MSRLESSRYGPFDEATLLWNSKTITKVHEHTVRVLRVIVSTERASNSHVHPKAFGDSKDGCSVFLTCAVRPLQTRGAVDEHYDVRRLPERRRIRPDVDQFYWSCRALV